MTRDQDQTPYSPEFLESVDDALERGWNEVAARMERHAAAGYRGDWTDPAYDQPSPTDLEDGDTRA